MKGIEKLLNKVAAENIPYLGKDMGIHALQAYRAVNLHDFLPEYYKLSKKLNSETYHI